MTNHIDHFEAMFDSNYLRWFDLDGQSRLVTIAKIERDVELTMRGGVKSTKPVIHFRETAKPLVMNKTNMASIAGIHGVQPSKWIGKQVQLIHAKTEMYDKELRKMVERDCIRIRPTATENKREDAQPEEVRQAIATCREFVGTLSKELLPWDKFVPWVSVVLDRPNIKTAKDLATLTQQDVERMQAAAMELDKVEVETTE